MFAFKYSAIVAAFIVSSYAIPAPDAGAKPFTLQNGKDALALNDRFQTLAANSKCTDGEDACVEGKFAACTGGKFALTQCGAGTVCAALPLVNSPGTAVTCTTEADRDARIAATGASGASGASSADDASADDAATVDTTADDASAEDAAAAPSADDTKSSASAGGFQLQNGKDAVAETAKDAKLTPDSPCTENQNACIDGDFAQCANGKFVLTPCGGGLKCFTLPLLNKAGTSNTCTTQADATQRIKNSGASN